MNGMLSFFSEECKDVRCCTADDGNDGDVNDVATNGGNNNYGTIRNNSGSLIRRAHTEEDNSLAMSRQTSRSLSPTFLYSQHNLFCDEDNANNLNSVTHATGNNNSGYEPFYTPSDFTSQTWLTVLTETLTIPALAGGATVVLGAAVIVHPLGMMGAAGKFCKKIA